MSKVYFTNLRTNANMNLLYKLERLVKRAGIGQIDFRDKFTAVKIHFGEPGNLAYIRHNYAAKMVEILESFGAKVFFTDSNTLYSGRRSNAVDHLTGASDNGFNQLTLRAPVIIADGLKGTEYTEMPVPNGEYCQNRQRGSQRRCYYFDDSLQGARNGRLRRRPEEYRDGLRFARRQDGPAFYFAALYR